MAFPEATTTSSSLSYSGLRRDLELLAPQHTIFVIGRTWHPLFAQPYCSPLTNHHNNRNVYTGLAAQPTISLSAMLESVNWISPTTAESLRTSTRYEAANRLLDEIASSGIRL